MSIIISLAIVLLRASFSGGFQWLYIDTSEIFLKDWILQINQQVESWERARIRSGRMYFLWSLASIVSLICCSIWWANWRIFCKNALLMWKYVVCVLQNIPYPLKSIFSCNEVNCLCNVWNVFFIQRWYFNQGVWMQKYNSIVMGLQSVRQRAPVRIILALSKPWK